VQSASSGILIAGICARRRVHILRPKVYRLVSARGVLRGQDPNGSKALGFAVEQPTKFEFIVNLKAAKQIGLTKLHAKQRGFRASFRKVSRM
jgi:hypothetical protein